MTTPAGVRAWRTTTITLVNMVRSNGKLFSLRDKTDENETKMFMVCPKCKASRVDQLYCCQTGCTPDANDEEAGKAGWRQGNVTDRGHIVDDKLAVMSEEEIDEAKASKLEKGVLDLVRCPATEVEAQTWPSGSAWWFEPDKQDPLFALLVEYVRDEEWAYIGTVNLSGDKFVRVRPHNGGLVIQELLRPSEVRTYEMGSVVYSPKEQAMFDSLMGAVTEDFDPDAFSGEKVQALRDLIASKSPTAAASITPIAKGKKAAAIADDLTDQLAAALAAAQAARAAKAS